MLKACRCHAKEERGREETNRLPASFPSGKKASRDFLINFPFLRYRQSHLSSALSLSPLELESSLSAAYSFIIHDLGCETLPAHLVRRPHGTVGQREKLLLNNAKVAQVLGRRCRKAEICHCQNWRFLILSQSTHDLIVPLCQDKKSKTLVSPVSPLGKHRSRSHA